VCQLAYLTARRAYTTRVAILAVGAVEVLGIGYRQRQCSHPRLARKELGVADATSVDILGEFLFESLLPYNVRKSHKFYKIA
jgi:hypothetical protein